MKSPTNVPAQEAAAAQPDPNSPINDVMAAPPKVSEVIKTENIIEALARAQQEYPPIVKSKLAQVRAKSGATFDYKYADLADCLVVLPILAKYGIAVMQPLRRNQSGEQVIVTEFHHVSKEVLTDDGLTISRGLDPQDFGNVTSYMRRYGFCMMAMISPGQEEERGLATLKERQDKDANKARGRTQNVQQPAGAAAEKVTVVDRACSPEQLEEIKAALKAAKRKVSEMYVFINMPMGQPIPVSLFEKIMKWIASPAVPEKITDAYKILDWSAYEQQEFNESKNFDWELISTSLNTMIDEKAAEENA